MIINVTYGNAEDIGRYIQGPAKEHGRNVSGTEDRARIIEEKGFGFPVRTQDDVDLARAVMRKDLDLQHSNTKPITNTGVHSSMSWPEGYQPTREEMRQAVDGLAKAWGMEGARRITWSHSDTEHRHIHTLWDPVHPITGRAYHDHERNDRAQREAIRQEREHGPLPASRQRDHDKAAAAEASDHARTYELSKNTDGSISRRSLDRALSLGGRFGPDKTVQRKEFIERNSLTKFPRQHFDPAYAPPEVAREKRDYIRENREASSTLTRAYNREAGERAHGVFRLYEDHSFEQTSKPPVQEERKESMGINDFLDWPWKKAKEVIRETWQGRSDRNFEEKLKEKSGDMLNPEVQQEWFKRYGKGDRQAEVSRERPRKDSGGRTSPEDVIREMKIDEGRKGAATEHARLKNWEVQRERRDKEEGRGSSRDNTPPWRKEEQRSQAYRRQKELEQEERDSKPLPETRLQKHWREQWAKLRPDHHVPLPGTDSQRQQQTPALPRPQEIPMPKIESRDRIYDQPHGSPGSGSKDDLPPGAHPLDKNYSGDPTRYREQLRKVWGDDEQEINRQLRKDEAAKADREGKPEQAQPQERETKWDKEFREREREGKGERRFQDGIDKTTNQQEPKPPQAQGLPREWWKATRELEDIARGMARGNARDQSKSQDTRTPQQIEQDEHGMVGKKIPDNSQEIENRHRQRAKDYFRDEEPRDAAAEREENWKRDLDKINKELGKEQAERPEQGQELPRSPGPEETREDWVPPRLRKLHNQNDIAREESRQQNQDDIRRTWKTDEDRRNVDQRLNDRSARADGTAGWGRRDDTEAGKPGILPGGSHEHGSPSRQFRDQLNESLKKIKIPEREVGKEQERER